jgi:two-component system chemotaxis sensor kinase CheA
VERLDHLMNLVGELLIEQTSLADLSAAGQRNDPAKVLPDIGGVSDHMGSIIKELQEGVMKTRMLPIDQLFSRFPRLVRDLAQKLGKEIELLIQGGETELDRMIIEELSDPLIHLIRNSADHGIERPEVRADCGKPVKGRITLTSFHEENHVVIRLADDGQGIDAGKIKASALGKGIITEEQAGYLTVQEAVHLIFEPGFSTASEVSEVSGRGVGMDIVRSQIGRLNGIIDIETEPGKGTVFIIRLPLTLAIIKGLLVNVSGRVLILPMYNVAEIVRISPEEIQTVQGEQAIINHGRIVPFSWLREKLHYPRTERSSKTIPLVIIRSVDRIAAFAVDEIIGNQEVVIKSLGAYLGTMNHLSGATILGNGRVALILDASYLVSH